CRRCSPIATTTCFRSTTPSARATDKFRVRCRVPTRKLYSRAAPNLNPFFTVTGKSRGSGRTCRAHSGHLPSGTREELKAPPEAPEMGPDENMNSRAWSVDGIDPTVRERAEAAARRAGMSLNDWLNSTVGDAAPTTSRSAVPPKADV